MYKEQDFFDAVGYGVWAEVTTFDFKCQSTLFANDKIRVCYYLPMEPGAAVANFYNTNPSDAAKSGGKLKIEDHEKDQMRFVRSNTFRQQVITSFDPEMHGLNTFAVLFHSREAKNITLYNGWNFTRTYEWDSLTPDSFWYSPNTIMLFETEKFKIGSQASENVVLDLQPEKYIHKG
jgi:hypothetical protein